MEIIAHYDNEDNYLGYTFEGDLLPVMEIDRIVLEAEEELELKDNTVTFLTLEGKVVYNIVDFKWFTRRGDGFYTMNLKEDQRG